MHAADEGFVSVAELLARDAIPVPPAVVPDVALPVAEEIPDRAELLRDIRLFRARLADALDTARDALLRELAVAVVGRELLLAPADVAAIAARLIATHPAATPVRLRIAPDDVEQLPPVAPVHADPTLAPGDLILAFDDRVCDARLGVRLAAALEAWS